MDVLTHIAVGVLGGYLSKNEDVFKYISKGV